MSTTKANEHEEEITFRPVNKDEGVFEIIVPPLTRSEEYSFLYINKMFAFGID